MTETAYEEVTSWTLGNGDRVLIVRANITTPGSPDSRRRVYHWTVVAANGRKVATSGQTFKRARNAKRAAARNFPPAVEG
jgi:hypothetical protein